MSTVEAPKIVITEPSPMPPPREGRVPKEDKVPKEEAATASAMPSSVSIPATTEVAVSGEFKPSEEDSHCRGESSTTEQHEEPTERGSLENIPTYTPTEWCLLHYCRVWTQDWKLKCLIFFDIILLPVFVSAAYMGAVNIGKCSFNDSIPIMMFIIGVSGFTTAAYSTVETVRKLYGAPSETTRDSLVLPGAVMTITLLVTVTMIMAMKNPSYDPDDKNYCDKTFHTYVTSLIWCAIALLLTVLAFLGLKKLVKYIRNARTTQESDNEQ